MKPEKFVLGATDKHEPQTLIMTSSEIRSFACVITPEDAKLLLERNASNNRKPKGMEISRMVNDILNGNWMLTHQGIAIDVDGRLIDGQNRLMAIVQAGEPASLMVFVNVPVDAIRFIDIGKSRNTVDVGKVAGIKNIDTELVACARRMRESDAQWHPPISRAQELDFVRKHVSCCRFAIQHLPRPPKKERRGDMAIYATATVRGAVARAWNAVDREQLKKFCEDIQKRSEYGAVGLLRRTFANFASGRLSMPQMIECYLQTECAIEAYITGNCPKRLFAEKELFPLKKGR